MQVCNLMDGVMDVGESSNLEQEPTRQVRRKKARMYKVGDTSGAAFIEVILTLTDVQAQAGNAKDTSTSNGNDQSQAPQMNQQHQLRPWYSHLRVLLNKSIDFRTIVPKNSAPSNYSSTRPLHNCLDSFNNHSGILFSRSALMKFQSDMHLLLSAPSMRRIAWPGSRPRRELPP